jgi:hypothetical protein
MRRTTMITRQSLHQGTAALLIYESVQAYYVVHEDAQGHCTALPEAQFWTYEAAHSRLQQEQRVRERNA